MLKTCLAGALLAAPLLSLVVVGCGSSDDPAPSGSAGTPSGGSTTGTAGQSSSGATSTGGSSSGAGGGSGNTAGSSGAAGSASFAECGDRAPKSTCSVADTCGAARCGAATSSLDERGCVRATCTADSECSAGEVCFPTWVVGSDAAAANLQMCSVSDSGRCVCLGQANATGDAHCVTSASASAVTTCTLSSLVQNDCERLQTWTTNAETLLGKLTLSASVKTLSDKCLADAKATLDAMTCP